MVLYSSAFLAEQPKVLLNVVLFWAGAILLTALCVYQHCCFFSSAGTWDIFDLPSCGILGLLNAA